MAGEEWFKLQPADAYGRAERVADELKDLPEGELKQQLYEISRSDKMFHALVVKRLNHLLGKKPKRAPKGVTYTAIFGGIRDTLQTVPDEVAKFSVRAFTDTVPSGKQKGWHCCGGVWAEKDHRRRARKHKVLAHRLFPWAEYTLWVDGCLTPLTPLPELVKRYLSDSDVCVFQHMQRACVFQELEACIRLRKDDPAVMRKQVEGYAKDGYPHHNGLAETTAVLRRHNAATNELNERWWKEIQNKSLRDQLSFDYLCWKAGIKYNVFEGNRCQSPHFRWRPHR